MFDMNILSSIFGSDDILTFIIVAAIVIAALALSFLFVRHIPILRWILMVAGAVGFLFFAVLALIQYLRYNAGWEQDLIETGYIVYANHWSYTKYRWYFEVAMAGSGSLFGIFLMAHKAYDIDYVEEITTFSAEQSGPFSPVEVTASTREVEHTFFWKVIGFGFAIGIACTAVGTIVSLFFNILTSSLIEYIVDVVFGLVFAGLTILSFRNHLKRFNG